MKVTSPDRHELVCFRVAVSVGSHVRKYALPRKILAADYDVLVAGLSTYSAKDSVRGRDFAVTQLPDVANLEFIEISVPIWISLWH